MRKPRDYGALIEPSLLAGNEARAGSSHVMPDPPSGPSRDGHFYGTLRAAATRAPPLDLATLRASQGQLHPIMRSWTQRGDMVSQQRSANRWAQQSNQALARQAELRAGPVAPVTTLRSDAIQTNAERTPMAVQPHHSDSVFGMVDELEGAIGDVASGLANEAGNTAPEAAAAPELDQDAHETAQLMESAEAARAQEAAQANEQQQEQEHELE